MIDLQHRNKSNTRTQVNVTVNPSPTGIAVSGVSACNGSGTSCVGDDTYTANITVTYATKPASGMLSLMGADLVGSTAPTANVSTIGATSYTFTGVVLRADGQAIDLTAVFSEGGCAYTNSNAGVAPASCSTGGSDTQAPTITCPANIVRSMATGTCSAFVTYVNPAISDNCNVGLSSVPVPPSLPSGAEFPQGVSTVVWRVTDAVGLTATCSFTVTVNDTQQPSISCPPNQTVGNTIGSCTAVVSYTTPTYSDNCTGGGAALQSGLPSGGSFPKGATTVVWKATDAAGLTKTCSFRVTVNDTESPAITCPAGQTVNTSAVSCVAPSVTYSAPTAVDNCMPAPTVTRILGPASGSQFPIGSTSVVWRAIDGAGRSSTCSFSVTVTDNQAPLISCPPSQTVTAAPGQCNAVATYTSPTATDNCGVATLFLLSGQPSGSTYPQGVTTNAWRATDSNGGSATCSFSITVNCGTGANEGAAADRRPILFDADIKLPLTMDLAPNPATADVQVLIDNLGKRSGILSLFDAQGRLMWQQVVEGDALPDHLQVLQVSSYPSGLYFVTLAVEGTVLTKRLVVEK